MLEQRVYKNYKELCKAMNWSTTGGNTKTKYLKELDSLCKWHKDCKYFYTAVLLYQG